MPGRELDRLKNPRTRRHRQPVEEDGMEMKMVERTREWLVSMSWVYQLWKGESSLTALLPVCES